jgi:hypothetical protein
MNILSNWKLTYDPAGTPLVLLDYGAELADEPDFSLRRGLEVVSIPYGVPFLRPTKHDVYDVAIAIMHSSASDAEARRDMLNQLSDRYSLTSRVPMRLEARDMATVYHQWSAAFIHSASVKRLVTQGIPSGWLLRYSFTAVGFTKMTL